VALDELIDHRFRAALRETHVVVEAADIVRMSDDIDLEVGLGLEQLADLGERGR